MGSNSLDDFYQEIHNNGAEFEYGGASPLYAGYKIANNKINLYGD